ncbi:HAD family hydrolase [Macrococcus capreoli]|uniref:HAD family hydrolase n=1 Tax=Macrococcus capreoli TaxID=2982690 RepID=UPI003EE49E9C
MYEHILFDLDGTLTDPHLGITNSIIYSLNKMGIDAPDNDALTPFIGPPLQESYEVYYNLSGDNNLEAVRLYREYFSDKGMYENEVYPGIELLLQALKSMDKKLYVATSKPTYFARPILEHFNLDHYFESITGSELDGTRTDKAEIIQHVLETHNLDKSTCIMIGDRKHDIIGAQKNNIDSIGVLYGYGSADEIKQASPTYTIATVDYLLEGILNKIN